MGATAGDAGIAAESARMVTKIAAAQQDFAAFDIASARYAGQRARTSVARIAVGVLLLPSPCVDAHLMQVAR